MKYISIHTKILAYIKVYFLNSPNVDFAVGGLANVTDLPGISGILR